MRRLFVVSTRGAWCYVLYESLVQEPPFDTPSRAFVLDSVAIRRVVVRRCTMPSGENAEPVALAHGDEASPLRQSLSPRR